MQVAAVAGERLVRLLGDLDVEVAGRAAAGADLALAGQPDAHAVLDAGRHVDGDRAAARTRPSVPQVGHGDGICSPVPAHAVQARVVMTWPRNERCTDCDLARAAAGRAGARGRAGRAARAVARLAERPRSRR